MPIKKTKPATKSGVKLLRKIRRRIEDQYEVTFSRWCVDNNFNRGNATTALLGKSKQPWALKLKEDIIQASKSKPTQDTSHENLH